MIELINGYWAVEVPGKYAQITIDPVGPVLMWWSYEGTETGVSLPPGTWEIVCTSKEVTEDQCAIIAGLSFQDVVHGYSRTFFNDLLTSKGCDLNKAYLILKNTL
jgi:hypothetical protein